MNITEEGAKIILLWDKNDGEDIERAKKAFTHFTRQGWLATRRNGKTSRILEFKPEYGEIIFMPLSEGG